MTTGASHQSLTLEALLFGEKGARHSLQAIFDESGVVKSGDSAFAKLNPAGLGALTDLAAQASIGLFHVDFVEIIGAAWRKHAELRSAAQRSLASPGAPELVQLSTHRMSYMQRPSVDLSIDDVVVLSLAFQISVDLLVRGLVARIQGGRISGLDSGTCDLTAKLALNDVPVAYREHRLELPFAISVGNGIPLIEDDETPHQERVT